MCYNGGCDHGERDGLMMETEGMPRFERNREGSTKDTGTEVAEKEAGVGRISRSGWSDLMTNQTGLPLANRTLGAYSRVG